MSPSPSCRPPLDPPLLWESLSGQHGRSPLAAVGCFCGRGDEGGDGGGSVCPPSSETREADAAGSTCRPAADRRSSCYSEEGGGHAAGRDTVQTNVLKDKLINVLDSQMNCLQPLGTHSVPAPAEPQSSSPVRKAPVSPPPGPSGPPRPPASSHTESEADSLLEELRLLKDQEGLAGGAQSETTSFSDQTSSELKLSVCLLLSSCISGRFSSSCSSCSSSLSSRDVS